VAELAAEMIRWNRCGARMKKNPLKVNKPLGVWYGGIMKSTRKSQPSKLNSILSVSDPFSGIEVPVSSASPMSKTTKYKGANKALRLLLLIESWHVYAEHLILLSKKNSSRSSHASNSHPSRTRVKGIMRRLNLLPSKGVQELSAVVRTSTVK
jgi:hypothetical protein